MKHATPIVRRLCIAVLPSLLALAIAPGCSSGSGGGSASATLTFALTDAASDEVASFVVDVESVVLQRADGSLTSVLAETLRIDLASLGEVSQVLNIVNLPAGLYSAATVTIDFTSASCILIGETTPADILDGDRNPVSGSVAFPIEVSGSISAVANRNQVVELDFDLDRSMEVDAADNEVFLEPVFALRVDRSDPKDLVLVGELVSVDSASSSFVLELQTFARMPIGDVTIEAAGAIFQIDGVPSGGAAGLDALSAKGPGVWVQCYGEAHPELKRVVASHVEAGLGTYHGGTDIVDGHVIGRLGAAGSDATLTVLGYGENAAHTSSSFNTTFTVLTSFADTKVLRRGSVDVHDSDDINIGQRVRVFGALNGTMMDGQGAQGIVRLQPTRVLGFAADAASAGTLTIDLVRVDLRLEDRFAWSEGGTTPPDPNALTIAVDNLADGLGIGAGTAVEARGLFAPVDDGQQDFVASSLTNRDASASLLVVRDRAGGMTLTPTVDQDGLRLDLVGDLAAGEVARIDRGFVGSADLPRTPPPSIRPPDQGPLFYSLRNRNTGEIQLHLEYPAWADALLIELGRGAVIYDVNAIGSYDPPQNRMTASLLGVVVD